MKRFLIIFCLLLMAVPGTAQSAQVNIWDDLSDTTHQALQLTKQQKYDKAKQFLEKFSVKFLKANREEMNLSMLQLRILTVSYDRALKSMTSVSETHENRTNAVMQFYLVIDALRSENSPLWMKTEKQVMTPFQKMKSAAHEKDEQSYQYYLNEFLNEYEMIHPALNVDLHDFVMERLDSRIQFLSKHRSHFFSDPEYVKQLDEIEKELKAVFSGKTEQSMNPALPWLILTIGGMITITLIYVGWRKYKAETKAKKLRKRSKY